MAPNSSFLSSPANGYDFVVATTEEAINAGLIQYLQTAKQPVTTICFLADDKGTASTMLTLPELLAKTENINPFDIPDGTEWSPGNYKINVLTRARFLCAIELKMGIPPGMVQNIPGKGPQIVLKEPVLTLQSGSGKAVFCMYCSSLRVCLNAPPSGWGAAGSWNIYSQKPGNPWYARTTVDLTTSALDQNLNTTFFNERPDWKAQVQQQLNNLSGTALSIQQLLVNLDSALMQSVPKFIGIDNTTASNILTNQFINTWSANAQATGMPLVSLQAVPQKPDQSPLQIKALERWISPVVDPNTGVAIATPNATQGAAKTLNYLCSTTSAVVPSAHSFNWNWVEPDALSQSSGVISINRNTLSKYFVGQLNDIARSQCPIFKTDCHIDLIGNATYSLSYGGLGQPSVVYHPEGNRVVSISFDNPGESSSKASEAAHCSWNVRTQYACDIYFGGAAPLGPFNVPTGGNTIVIAQSATVNAYMSWNANSQGCWVVRKTIVDAYTVSAGPDGQLLMTQSTPIQMDTSESPDTSNWVVPIGDRINSMKQYIQRFSPTKVPEQELDKMGRFILPGAMVFTYSNATFSDHQDLTSLITYKKPTGNQFAAASVSKVANVASTPSVKALSQSDVMTIVGQMNQLRVARALPTMLHDVNLPSSKTLPNTSLRAAANPGSSTNQSLTISCTSELIQNYVQGELVGPQGEFEAVQTSDGHSLLFAISTSGVLNVFEEKSGQSQTGWSVQDISSQITKSSGSTVAQFAVGQSVMDAGSIGLAISTRSNGTDSLYLSLRHSNTDTSWIGSTTWTQIPYDGKQARSSIEIADIYFSETDQNMQYIIVDLVRDPKSTVKHIDRYLIDPTAPAGSRWTVRALPFEVEAGKYQSCTGRSSDSLTDVVYTGGTIVNQSQLAYVPFFNLAAGDSAPMPTTLAIPGGLTASAIVAARNGDKTSDLYGTSDLYVTAGYTLYRWASDNQLDADTQGIPVLTSTFISGTDRLIAVQQNGMITLFGRNANDEVWYTSCSLTRIGEASAWNLPVPIMKGIEKITAFVNSKDGSNTIFAAGGGKISRIVQSTGSAGKIWLPQDIQLASPPTQPCRAFKSYTTIVNVTGTSPGPVGQTTIQIAASMRIPVYIQGLYYVLSSVPIHVQTDTQGQIDIVQATDSLVAPLLTITVEGTTTTCDPAKKSWDKLAQIKTPQQLRSATFATSTVGGGVIGTTQRSSLIAANVSDADAQAVVDSIQGLTDTYNKMSPNASVSAATNPTRTVSATVVKASSQVRALSLSWDGIVSGAGDLFRSIGAGIGKFIEIVRDGVTGAWHFVCQIAGKIYHAILDSTQAILGALEWVFDKIKTAVMDVIHFLEFLFEWDDIKRTKNVLHNVIKLYMLNIVNDITTFQGDLDKLFDSAQKSVATWAGKPDWNTLGDVASKKVVENGSDPSANQTSGSQLFMNHFKNNVGNLSIKGAEPAINTISNLINDLIAAVKAEGKVLQETFERLKALATDFHSLSLTDILKRLAAIMTEAALGSTKVVLHALLQVLSTVGAGAVAILDTPVHIPIISDILNAVGVPDISLLDLVTWIGAVGYTVVYKLVKNEAPFPDDQTTKAMIAATNWTGLNQALNPAPVVAAMSTKPTDLQDGKNSKPMPVRAMINPKAVHPLFKAGHAVSSFLQAFGNWVFVAEAMDETAASKIGRAKTALAILIGVSSGAADALVGHYQLKQQELVVLGRITLATTILSAVFFSGPVQGWFAATLPVEERSPEGRKFGSYVNVALILPALAGSAYHFYELSQYPASDDRSATIVGECATLMTFFSRVSYCVTLQIEDPEVRIIPAMVMAAFNAGYAGLQFAETIVG